MVRQSRAPVVILTRPAAQSARFTADLLARWPGLRVITSPVIAPEFLPLADLPPVSAVIFTSETGVAAMAQRRADLPDRAYCVGARTAAAAQAAGFDTRSADGDAEALFRLIVTHEPRPGPLLHLCGEDRRGDLAERLTHAGYQAGAQVVYAQRALPLGPQARAALAGADPVLLPVFSPRSARILAQELQAPAPRAPYGIAAISAAAAAPFASLPPNRLKIAERPDAAAMLDACVAVLNGLPWVEPWETNV
ncbi:uroporphyrinogen-III synthase [Gemmobacter denitrificans]|uniref:Uroporphyrinogen-III synthase n=1 Tax=Gemmobacter denitrificans TaxID=3123040 RepID=A0ABU8BSQ1_9RHOB